MDDLVIRQAVSADTAAIGQLWRKLVDYHRKLDRNLPAATQDGSERYAKRVADTLQDTYTQAFVAEQNGKVVGFVIGVIVDLVPDMFEGNMGGFLADIYVDDAYRGQGAGRQLVEAITRWFRSRGVAHFEWNVAANNPEGRAFWESIGGQPFMIRMRIDL